jgi:proteasome lid subunit RPN8/RPN11
MPFRLQLPRRLYEEMVAQAVAELPNECCGLLAGSVTAAGGVPLGRVVRRYPLVNAAASPVEYLSESRSLFTAVRTIRPLGLDIVAVYHSHPTSEPVPSRKDLHNNYYTEAVHFIISLGGEAPEMRGWWLTSEDYREADWELVAGESENPG